MLRVSSVLNIDLDWISITCFFGNNFLTSYSIKLLLPVYFAALAVLSLGLNKIHKAMVATGFGRYIRKTFPEASAGPGTGTIGYIKHRLVIYLAEYKPISWRTVVNSMAAFLDLAYIYLVSTVCFCAFSSLSCFFTNTWFQSFEVFQCFKQPDGSRSLLSDATITCFTPAWYRLLPSAIIALLFYGIGVPAAFAIILYQ